MMSANDINTIDKLAFFKQECKTFRTGAEDSSVSDPSRPFEVWHPSFHSILGSSPKLHLLVDSPDYAFAWEAPIWTGPEKDEVFFCSQGGSPQGQSGLHANNKIFKLKLKDLKLGESSKSLAEAKESFIEHFHVDHPGAQMTNGGTPYRGKLLFTHEGRGEHGGAITLINPEDPTDVKVLVHNLYGRRFNAPNDLVVHPKSGAIFWTDPIYATLLGFGPEPEVRNQTYRFNPQTGELRAMTDQVRMPNGIAFSPEGDVVYITDTGSIDGKGNWMGPKGSAIYAFDVVDAGDSQNFTNMRLFAWVDRGVPDGIKVDTEGNVYSGCGDGVHVWNKHGVLVGKVYTGKDAIGNLAFCGKGRLVFHSGERLYLAELASEGVPLLTYGSE